MLKLCLAIFISALFAISCDKQEPNHHAEIQGEVQQYLDKYNLEYQKYLTEAAEAEWVLNTKIVEGDTISATKSKIANEAFAAFTGSKENIEMSKKYLEHKEHLTPLQVKQLEAILYFAGANPSTVSELVKEKISADTKQTEDLFGFDFKNNGKSISPNEIDKILQDETDLKKRIAIWEASKEVGKKLKPGLVNLQNLRNKCVQALGYSDYFSYQVSEYGMTSEEMIELSRGMIKELWPLYRELHTWARYELAAKYKQKEVPEMLPAHWLPNRWGQEWSSMVNVEGINLDEILKTKSPEWIVKEGEKFYMSLGFPALPASFYEKSSLYPVEANAGYKKNTHASAWHMNNAEDVRSLMSVEPNTKWWGTVLHELGHIYYYMSYTNPDVPIILRSGANRAYHEGIGTMMGLAAMQTPFLQGLGLLPNDVKTDEIQTLLKEALDYVVVIPWGAGVMTEFEYELYSKNLPADQYNKKWWELVKKYQGIVPPSTRSEEYCDAASKTHINNDPAQYYDYSISTILFFQLHDHISKKILKQDPHATNYYGNKDVGKFLKDLTYPGATVNWKEHLQASIGTGLSAKAMVDYFEPLMKYLKEQNKNRVHTLPESF